MMTLFVRSVSSAVGARTQAGTIPVPLVAGTIPGRAVTGSAISRIHSTAAGVFGCASSRAKADQASKKTRRRVKKPRNNRDDISGPIPPAPPHAHNSGIPESRVVSTEESSPAPLTPANSVVRMLFPSNGGNANAIPVFSAAQQYSPVPNDTESNTIPRHDLVQLSKRKRLQLRTEERERRSFVQLEATLRRNVGTLSLVDWVWTTGTAGGRVDHGKFTSVWDPLVATTERPFLGWVRVENESSPLPVYFWNTRTDEVRLEEPLFVWEVSGKKVKGSTGRSNGTNGVGTELAEFLYPKTTVQS